MCKSNYITKHYAILTYGLCILFVVALGISAWITIKTEIDKLSYGIVILLFADVTLAVLSIVSMVAMFHEVSRLHAREFPKDVMDQMNKLGKKLDQLSEEFKTEKNNIEKITSLSSDCAKFKEMVVGIAGKLDDVISQHGCVEGSGKRMRIMDAIKNQFNKKRNHFSSKEKKHSETPTSSDTQNEQKEESRTSVEGGNLDTGE